MHEHNPHDPPGSFTRGALERSAGLGIAELGPRKPARQDEARPLTPMEVAIRQLHGAGENALREIAMLTERLEPVLGPITELDREAPKPEPEPLSELIRELQAVRRTFEAVSHAAELARIRLTI